jgi:sodium bicarbonate cotransporter 7
VQFIQRIMLMFMPSKFQPDYAYLRHVKLTRVHIFTLLQILCMAGMWIVKSIKAISIGFPIMVGQGH